VLSRPTLAEGDDPLIRRLVDVYAAAAAGVCDCTQATPASAARVLAAATAVDYAEKLADQRACQLPARAVIRVADPWTPAVRNAPRKHMPASNWLCRRLHMPSPHGGAAACLQTRPNQWHSCSGAAWTGLDHADFPAPQSVLGGRLTPHLPARSLQIQTINSNSLDNQLCV
jgi:hypothetical protein